MLMLFEEYNQVKNAILTDAELQEVITKIKITDEYGEQMVVSKTENKSPAGNIVQEFSYSGDTRNWSLQNTIEYLVIDGQRYDLEVGE